MAEVDPQLHGAQVLIADTLDGKPLSEDEGPFKLIVGDDLSRERSVPKLLMIELRAAE